MRELGAAGEAAADHAAMHLALELAGADGRKHLGERRIEERRAGAEAARSRPRVLMRRDLVHQVAAVQHGHGGQAPGDVLPEARADEVLVEADAAMRARPRSESDACYPIEQRLRVAVEDLKFLDPGIAGGGAGGRRPRARRSARARRGQTTRTPRREAARSRWRDSVPWKETPGEVGDVLAAADDHGREARRDPSGDAGDRHWR